MSSDAEANLNDLPQEILEMVFSSLGTRELLFGPRQTSQRLRDACERELVLRKEETAEISQRIMVILWRMLQLTEDDYWEMESFRYPQTQIIHHSSYTLKKSDEVDSDGKPVTYSALRLRLPVGLTSPVLPPVDINIDIEELTALDREFKQLIKRGLWVPGETQPNGTFCSCHKAQVPYHNMNCAFLNTVEGGILSKMKIDSIAEGMEQFAMLQELYEATDTTNGHIEFEMRAFLSGSEQPNFTIHLACGERDPEMLPGCSHVPKDVALGIQLRMLKLLPPLFKHAWVHSRNRLSHEFSMHPDLFFAVLFREWRHQFHGRLGAYESFLRIIYTAWI